MDTVVASGALAQQESITLINMNMKMDKKLAR